MRKGYTMLELLVVISIIAILMALLYPVYSKATYRARKVTCVNNMRQIGLRVDIAREDNDGKIPYYSDIPQICQQFNLPPEMAWCSLKPYKYNYTMETAFLGNYTRMISWRIRDPYHVNGNGERYSFGYRIDKTTTSYYYEFQ